MALLNLSLVTKSLVALIKEHVTASPAWPGSMTLTVSPQPPDELKGDSTLGLYLYHASEDAQFKNLPPPGPDPVPVRCTPMGLNLYYQLSAHSDSEDANGAYHEQLMLGCAIKALHDYPVIDDSTEINGVKILDPLLQGKRNRLRIVLQPVAHDQAVTYWTAGSSHVRLSAYYQVSVVLLEPEEPLPPAGRVLVYGVHTFTVGSPRLDSSSNVVTFSIPGEAEPRQIELRPAQAPPAKPAVTPPEPEASKVTFSGSNLAGSRVRLLLRNARWKKPVETDVAWDVTLAGDDLKAVVRQTAGAEDVIPGIYSALVQVTRQRTMPDGRVRDFEHVSNETPFAVTPRIDLVNRVGDVVTVTGYVFQHADLVPGSVQVYLGDEQLVAGIAGGLNPGEFAATGATDLELRLPAGLVAGAQVPLRLFVNGVEAAPWWIQV